jgi:hypothetical protein
MHNEALRNFSCFMFYEGASTPALTLILAKSEERARELALREFAADKNASAIELCEGQTLLWRHARERGV